MATICQKNINQLPVRLMFQDEARFGRISDPRSCWAPKPHRPLVDLALIREFRYEYATVSPWDGCLDFMTSEKMNTENMSLFLSQVRDAHKNDFIIMVVDGASSHKSKVLKIPANLHLLFLPPYSPELNLIEILWKRIKYQWLPFDAYNSFSNLKENLVNVLDSFGKNTTLNFY